MSLDLACGVKTHTHAERGADLYETPVEATRALMAVEKLPNRIWEPACGPGAIVKELRAAGHRVCAEDLHDWGCPRSDSGIDFLINGSAPSGFNCIVTNPPYKLAADFVRKGLELVDEVHLLVRLAFYESESRRDILDNGKLYRILQFRDRLPMMHRHGWEGNKASSAVAFCWMSWSNRHDGPTKAMRISWKDYRNAYQQDESINS